MTARLGAGVDTLFAFSTIATFWLGGYELSSGRLTAGSVVACVFLGSQLSQSVGELIAVYGNARAAAAASDRIAELLAYEIEPPDNTARAVPAVHGPLCLRSVSVLRGQRTVLRGVDLTVSRGDVVAIVGDIGCGKTTLLHTIARLLERESGEMMLGRIDLCRLNPTAVRRLISYVTQDSGLFAGSVLDNLTCFSSEVDPRTVERVTRLIGLDDVVATLPKGYETHLGDNGVALSGGQQQLVNVARGLIRRAPVLLLDEPTSAMDVETERTALDVVRTEAADRIVLIVTHRSSALRIADRIVSLDNGEITRTDEAWAHNCGRSCDTSSGR